MSTRPPTYGFKVVYERIRGQRLGRDYDTIVSAEHALTVIHWVLGAALSISHSLLFILDHPRSLDSGVTLGMGGLVFELLVFSAAIWLPFVVSWFFARVLVVGLQRGPLVFSILAVIITGGAVAYQWSPMPLRASMLQFSTTLLLALLLASALAAAAGGRRTIPESEL